MAYDHNMINNYDHLMDSPSGSHLGSKNSNPHYAGGNAGYTTFSGAGTMKTSGGAKEHNPGGATNVASKKGDSGIGRDM